jgi:SPP1 family holin
MNEKISARTISRTVILALALINQLLSASGRPLIPIEDAQIETIISVGITIVVAIITWWKNNSFTVGAIVGDKVMDAVNNGEVGADFIEKTVLK